MLRLLAAAVALALPTLASAQPEQLQSNTIMTYESPKEWIVRYRLMMYPVTTVAGSVGLARDPTLDLTGFSLVAPFVPESAAASAPTDEFDPIRVDFKIDGRSMIDHQPAPIVRVPGHPAPYIRFAVDEPVSFNHAIVSVHARLTAYETIYDETAANEVPWPEAWPRDASAWLTHDPVFDVEPEGGEDPVAKLLEKWTGGNDPKQIPPAQLAKFLTGHVLSHVRVRGPQVFNPVGGTARYGDIAVDGHYKTNGQWVAVLTSAVGGINVKNAAEVAATRIGSEHDLANLLAAVLRRAGLPARTVIGIDDEENGSDQIKSWVEFALVPQGQSRAVWIPVDVRELKSDGRTDRNWQQTWKHFGTSDLMRHTLPIAYHFHPPADYGAFNHPLFYGAKAQGLPVYGSQALVVGVDSAPNRGEGKGPWNN